MDRHIYVAIEQSLLKALGESPASEAQKRGVLVAVAVGGYRHDLESRVRESASQRSDHLVGLRHGECACPGADFYRPMIHVQTGSALLKSPLISLS